MRTVKIFQVCYILKFFILKCCFKKENKRERASQENVFLSNKMLLGRLFFFSPCLFSFVLPSLSPCPLNFYEFLGTMSLKMTKLGPKACSQPYFLERRKVSPKEGNQPVPNQAITQQVQEPNTAVLCSRRHGVPVHFPSQGTNGGTSFLWDFNLKGTGKLTCLETLSGGLKRAGMLRTAHKPAKAMGELPQ